MPQQHLDRLTAVDASFLHQEGPTSHMHIGAMMTFEGPPPAFDDFLDHIRSRLHLVPRYRQKLETPPLGSGRPLWIDDPNFNLEYHVRHTALPPPGSAEQLRDLTARTFAQHLDRSKPLWEMWMVEGLDDGRFALISKTHHSLVDGVSGVDLATVIFDLAPVADPRTDDLDPWRPASEPGPAEVLAAGVKDLALTGIRIASRAVRAATSPAAALEVGRDAAEGVGDIAWAVLNPAPHTPLNVEIGPHRRYRVIGNELADFRHVKTKLGGTVNDVVLTIVSGGLGRWLHSRGVRTAGLEMRALVPVSVRAEGRGRELGNQIVLMRGPLPVYIADDVRRLQVVRRAMDGLKESKQAVGAKVIASVNQLAPPTILAQASRLQFSTRLFNLIVTNVPGPQFPLYVLGRELQDLYPVAFLPKRHALAVAIMSYNGKINFGLLGDYDALPDIDLIADGIEESLAALLRAAGRRPRRASDPRAGATRQQRSSRPPARGLPRSGSRRAKDGPAADMRAAKRRAQAKKR